MSAIWGMVTEMESASFMTDVKQRMQLPYMEKCKIDRIESKEEENLFFFCGIQYITEEAKREVLPISNHNCIMTVDCIIDNREYLISELKTDPSSTDGQLFFQAYQKWGTDCFSHVEGLYAAAIYDKDKKQLYLAVDRMAYRSLYYCCDEGKWYFSTLIEPIVRGKNEIELNEMYLKDFLIAPGMLPNVSDVETPFSDIYQMKPGTFLTISREGIGEIQYWTPESSKAEFTYRNAETCKREFRNVYQNCVNRAIRTCGEVGSALSSGFDSASVSALAADLLKKRQKKLFTYTYVPAPEFDVPKRNINHIWNEKEDVLKLVKLHPNMDPEFVWNEGKNWLENYEEMQRVMEVPYKAYVNIPNLNEIYKKSYDKGCRIVLIGQCGNSTVSFGKIDHILYDLYERGHWMKALKWLNHYSKTIKESRKQAFSYCAKMYHAAKKAYREDQFDFTLSNRWLQESILEGYPCEQRYRESGRGRQSWLPMNRACYRSDLYQSSMYTYLGAMETKLGLHQGIVLRDPTRDPEMVSFCYHMPYHFFAYQGITRWLIREGCREILPKEILENYLRYGVQNIDWLKRMIRDKREILPIFQTILTQGKMSVFFREKGVQSFLSELKDTDEWDELACMDLMYLFTEGYFEYHIASWKSNEEKRTYED